MKKLMMCLLCSAPFWALAQLTVQLDSTFANHGFSIVDQQTFETLTAVATQPDGKIVAVGFTEENNHSKMAVLRYMSDGSLDPTFGDGGLFTAQISPQFNVATALTLQADGKIVVAGYYLSNAVATYGEEMFLLRLTTQGVPDNSFNGTGFQTYVKFKNDRPAGITIGPDGKIYVVANSYKDAASQIGLFRYNQDGTADPGFGTAGRVALVNSSSAWNYCYEMKMQPDGKIWVVAESYLPVSFDNFTVMRVNLDGTYDTSFSGDGKITTSFSNDDDVPFSMVLLPNGGIVVGGYSVGADGHISFALLGLTASGDVDPNFGNQGKVITPVGAGFGQIVKMELLPDGDILVAGTAKNTCTAFDVVLAKYNQTGALQTDFADQGFLFTDYGQHYDGISDAQFLPDGKLLVVGSGVNRENSISEFMMAKFAFNEQVSTTNISNLITAAWVFPNPVLDDEITLQFTLLETSEVQIDLFALDGKQMGSLLHLAPVTGFQHETIKLPAGLPKGYYLAGIRTRSDRAFVKIIVQ